MEREVEFKEIFKTIMIDLNLNQTEVAAKLGIKQSQVSEWLKGKSKPGYDNLRNICIKLGVDPDELLGI